MLPSNNDMNCNNPIITNSNHPQTLVYHHKPFITNDHLFSSNLYPFPSSPTFIDHYETTDNDDFFLHQFQDLLPLITTLTDNNTNYNHPTSTTTAAAETTAVMVDYSNKVLSTTTTTTATPPRKRTSKRDRHSKINTAQGPRDRRMRLSLEIARDFFGLQDMLGYDKPSRTIEWLLSKAKSDIKKLVAKSSSAHLLIQSIDSSSTTVVGANTTSSASECEVISGGIDDHHIEKVVTTTTDQKPSKCVNKEKKKRLREVRKAAFRPARARESREKARARARERTKVKMCAKSKLFFADQDATTNQQDSNQVGSSSWSPTSLEMQQLAEVEKPSSHEVQQHIGATTTDMVHDDHSLVIMDKWSPASIFNYMHGSSGISQEHQFADFQFYNKPLESYVQHSKYTMIDNNISEESWSVL